MAGMITGASLADIYSRLNNTPIYHPMDASTFADWAVEAGDTVTLKRGEDEYTSPVHSANVVWKGAPQVTLSSAGSKEREAISKVSRRKYGRGAGMNNERGIYGYVWNTESTIYSYVEQTATYIVHIVEDVENEMGSAILQTASQIRSEVHASNSLLYSYIDQTATYINSHVEDVKNDIGSDILQTASQIRSEVHASNSQLYSYVDQTATYIASHVEDVANDLGSEILQTASQIRSEVHASNSQLYSYVDQTATYINQSVANVASGLQSQITQTSDTIGIIVNGTGANAKIKPAAIQASINAATGASKIELSADNIDLDGDVVTGALYGEDVTIGVLTTGGIENRGTLSLDINAPIIGYDGGTSSYSCGDMIVNAEVDSLTNTLTLTKLDGSTVTFNKAASITSLTGNWSGGASGTFPLTVKTNPDTGKTYTIDFGSLTANVNLAVERDIQHDPVQEIITGTKNMRQYIRVVSSYSGSPSVTRWSGGYVVVNATEMYNAGWKDYYDTYQYPPTIGSGVISSDIAFTRPGNTPTADDVTKVFTLSVANGYATVTSNGTLVYARVPASGTGEVTLTAGDWSSGVKRVKAFQEGSEVAYLDVTIPATHATNWLNTSGDEWKAQLTIGDAVRNSSAKDFSYIRTEGYNSGWYQYFLGWTYPSTIGSSVISSDIVVEHPGSTPTSDTLSKTFTLAIANGYATVSSGSSVYARVAVPTVTPVLTPNWSSAKLTVSSNPAAKANYTTTISSDFIKDGTSYYITSKHDDTELTATRKQYALVASGGNIVIQDGRGTQRANTPSIAITLDTGSVSSGKRTITVKAGGTATTVKATIEDYKNGYSAGWGAAYGKVSTPTATQTSSANLVIKVPPSTVDGNAASYTYTVSVGKYYAYIKYGSTTVAQTSHSQYTSGWNAAVGKVSMPGAGTAASMTVKVPPSTVDGAASSYTYTVSADDNYAYITQGSTTVARASHNAYSNGYNNGRTYGRGECNFIDPDFNLRYGNMYSGKIYTSGSGGTYIRDVTGTASTGIKIPLSENGAGATSTNLTEIPAGGIVKNGNYKFMSGYAGIRYLMVAVPNPYANELTFRCDSVQGGSTYTVKMTATPSTSMGSRFRAGNTYRMHWNW